MSLLTQLVRLSRQCPGPWLRPPLPGAALRATAAAAGGGGSTALPAAVPAAPALRHASSRAAAAPMTGRQRRRAAVAAAGKRGNVFVDDSAASKRKAGGGDDELPSAAKLFDSSRFNYDSDEDEEEEQQEQEQEEQGAAAAAAARGAAAQAADAQRHGEEEDEEADEEAPLDVVLPPARGVRVKSAEFVKSSVSVDQCPPARFPEFAVIGRSNVGKSSLINMLTGRSSLAMVSKTPGKTRCINHFIINGAWYLVDLPGYGYARTSKGNVVEWNRFTREYFVERETLVSVLLLVDASIPPMPLDVSCAAWFADAEIPFTVVFTKLDKRKKGTPPAEENIAAFEAKVQEAAGYVPPSILTSARSGRGRNELLSHVAQLRDFFNKSHHGM